MAATRYPHCTRCGSDDVLPFEEDSTETEDPYLYFIFLAIAVVFIALILFMISAYFFFPFSVFSGIILVTRAINLRLQEKKKRQARVLKDYVCLECGGFFKG